MISVLQIITTLEDKLSMTGHKTQLRTHRLDTKTGRLEKINKALSPNVKAAMKKKRTFKRGKRV